MILKLLLVISVIAIVYFLFIKKKPAKVKNKKNNSKKENPPANEMVECASCGVYCELEDTILSGNKYYCSQECVNKG